ncbi:MAG: HAD family hydrolase [Pseudomonadota bacterium]
MSKVLILDCDGVFAHTTQAHLNAANAAFAQVGLDLRWDGAMYARVSLTAGFRGQVLAYFGRFGWPGGEADNGDLITAVETAHMRHFISTVRAGEVPLRDDLGQLIDAAVAAGWTLAVCTDDHADLASACISRLGLSRASAIGVVAGSDSGHTPRPDSAIYETIAGLLGVDLDGAHAIVSKPFGAMAAKAAGIDVSVLVGTQANPAAYGGGHLIQSLDTGPGGLKLAA